ncbi:MAG: CHAT domain-containing protein [Candidatus Rokubacteria bacterium]|nr:CHAT domain-containing protein [Candidatus Rokubacteria bacterium]
MKACRFGALLLAFGGIIGCATVVSPERLAELKATEAESAARLTAEGELLYRAEALKKTGYQYCSIAVGLLEQGELRRGIREASKALFLGQQSRDEYLLANAKRDLAYAYSLAGYLDRAAQFAEEAIDHVQRAPGHVDRSVILGPAYKVRGDVRLRQGRVSEATRDYERALASSQQSFQPFVRVSLGNAYLASGNPPKARELFREAEAGAPAGLRPLIRRGLGQAALAEGQHQEAIRLFSEAAAQASGPDQAYHRLWALEGVGRARRAAADQAGALEAYTHAIAAAEQVRSRFRSEEFKTGFFGDIQRIFDEAVGLLVEAGQVEAALEISERSRSRALLDLLRGRVKVSAGAEAFAAPLGQAVSASELRAALPEGVAVAEYHVSPHRTYAWIIRRSGITLAVVEVERKILAHDIGRLRETIRARTPEAPELAAGLYAQLIRPLGLVESEALVVVPHDVLHYVPFHALRGPRGYLIEERPVSYAPSASTLVRLLAREQTDKRQVLALGNPDLGTPRLSLPGAQREVERIKMLFPAAEVYVRRDATKERFMARAPQNEVVHLAAHAEVDEIDPLYSVIHLAPTEKVPGDLEAHELYRMDLARTRFVSLSACDTGLGRVSRGDEIWGFTRAFFSAGTPALLVSLWPVEDESTARLMGGFYEELRHDTAHRALRTAQLGVLRTPASSHPFFWAPFVLVGDWR